MQGNARGRKYLLPSYMVLNHISALGPNETLPPFLGAQASELQVRSMTGGSKGGPLAQLPTLKNINVRHGWWEEAKYIILQLHRVFMMSDVVYSVPAIVTSHWSCSVRIFCGRQF